jgi:hypothetical protein
MARLSLDFIGSWVPDAWRLRRPRSFQVTLVLLILPLILVSGALRSLIFTDHAKRLLTRANDQLLEALAGELAASLTLALNPALTKAQLSEMLFERLGLNKREAKEYIEAFWTLYEPKDFLDRTYRCFLKLGAPKCKAPFKFPEWVDLRALAIIVWRQGIKRDTRWKFWHHFFGILKNNPAVWEHYLTVCAQNENFLEYREVVRDEIEKQLAEFQAREAEYRVPASVAS